MHFPPHIFSIHRRPRGPTEVHPERSLFYEDSSHSLKEIGVFSKRILYRFLLQISLREVLTFNSHNILIHFSCIFKKHGVPYQHAYLIDPHIFNPRPRCAQSYVLRRPCRWLELSPLLAAPTEPAPPPAGQEVSTICVPSKLSPSQRTVPAVFRILSE